jgi:hypothetical protein
MEYYVYEDEPKKARRTPKDLGVRFSMSKIMMWLALGLLLTGIMSLTLPDFCISCFYHYRLCHYGFFFCDSLDAFCH